LVKIFRINAINIFLQKKLGEEAVKAVQAVHGKVFDPICAQDLCKCFEITYSSIIVCLKNVMRKNAVKTMKNLVF
jgi:hypothetical protein